MQNQYWVSYQWQKVCTKAQLKGQETNAQRVDKAMFSIRLTVRKNNKSIFFTALLKKGRPTACVQIGQLFAAQWDFKHKNSEIDDIFLRWERFVDFQTYFKDPLCLE